MTIIENLYRYSIFMCLGMVRAYRSSLFNKLVYENHYGDGYGSEWIYFPDGDDIPHFVNLSIPEDEVISFPRSRLDDTIEYRLYTRNNSEDYIILDESGESLLSPEIGEKLNNKPLKVVTHGWRSTADKNAVINIKNAYLKAHDVNVIAVDWSTTADSIFYHWVAYQTVKVGSKIGSFLKSLNELYNVTGDQIHLIGHSLGAHVMGIAASNSTLTVDRVTGLDPARPLFEYPHQENSMKLDSSDATFVDVIHTCGGILGIEAAIGKIDFYPNNGIPPQPGCNNIQKVLEACSHSRSHLLYAESIMNPMAFPAQQCKNWIDFVKNRCDQECFMGERANRNMSGNFYLKTNPNEPFGRSIKFF